MGGHVLKTWSTTQNTIALSSGEAKLYAMTKAAAQVIGLMSLAMDFGRKIHAVVRTDSTAALGIIHREGLGRTRHVMFQYLCMQERLKTGCSKVKKIGKQRQLL